MAATFLPNLSQRERNIVTATIIVVGFALLYFFAVQPFLDYRSKLLKDQEQATNQLRNARFLLAKQAELQQQWKIFSLKSDVSQAENELQHAIQDWQHVSGVDLTSLKPDRPIPDAKDDRFMQVNFQIEGVGSTAAISRFIYQVEKSKLPARITSVHIRSHGKEGIDDLSMDMTVSTIFLAPPKPVKGGSGSGGNAAPVSSAMPVLEPVAVADNTPAYAIDAANISPAFEGVFSVRQAGDKPDEGGEMNPRMNQRAYSRSSEMKSVTLRRSAKPYSRYGWASCYRRFLPLAAIAAASMAWVVVAAVPSTDPTPVASPATTPATAPTTAPTTASSSRHFGQSDRHRRSYSRSSSAVSSDSVLPPQYRVLDQRSIFSRVKTDTAEFAGLHPTTGSDGASTGQTTSETNEPLPLKQTTILTGVLLADPAQGLGHYLAVFEDTQAAKAFTLHVGDPVADGRISDITIDYVDFETNGKKTRIDIGQNLEGVESSASLVATSAPTTEGSAPSLGGSADVLERLRQKRLKEMGK